MDDVASSSSLTPYRSLRRSTKTVVFTPPSVKIVGSFQLHHMPDFTKDIIDTSAQ